LVLDAQASAYMAQWKNANYDKTKHAGKLREYRVESRENTEKGIDRSRVEDRGDGMK
jgi:hypothetical protein